MPLCGRRTWSGQADKAGDATGEIVNLRQARKQKRRAEKELAAQENRVIHGRSAAEKIVEERAKALEKKRLEEHRREPSADD